MLFMFDNTFTQGNNNLFLMLFHSPSWPRTPYQTGCQQETDGMLKGVIEENLIVGLFMKVGQSSPKKNGEPLPAWAWEGREGRILTNPLRAADVGERASEGWNLRPEVVQSCHLQRWSWQRGGTVRIKVLMFISSSPLISCWFFLTANSNRWLACAMHCHWAEFSFLEAWIGLKRLGAVSR